MGGFSGDDPLSKAMRIVQQGIDKEAEEYLKKQENSYWQITKSCLNCAKVMKCNLPRTYRNARCHIFEPSVQHLAEIRQHNAALTERRRKQKMK